MHEFRWRLLWPALPATLASLIVWALFGAVPALFLFICILCAFTYHHLYWLAQLLKWLKKPETATIPMGYGIWEDAFAALYQDQRRHNRTQNQIVSALDRFQRAASALPDGVVLLSDTDTIEWCNPIAEQLLGLKLKQDSGQPIGYLVRQTEFAAYLQANLYDEFLKLGSAHNPKIMLQIQIVPFGDNQKLMLCRDISQLEKLETMRQDFIANVSHELRTPLTVVGGFLETLQDMENAVPESLQSYFAMMLDQTGRMRRLVEDLLTLSQLESNINTPQETEIDTPNLLKMVLAEGEGLSSGKHKLSLVLKSKAHLKGAHEELHSAFGNLVSNAIRYTQVGGEIKLTWEILNNQAVFSVTDTGIGIEPQHLTRITERFYRVDRSRSRATGGTGLGLSIVKHILTRHQAHLEVKSESGVGSVFSVVFPSERVIEAKATVAA